MKVYVCERVQVTRALCQVLAEYFCQFHIYNWLNRSLVTVVSDMCFHDPFHAGRILWYDCFDYRTMR